MTLINFIERLKSKENSELSLVFIFAIIIRWISYEYLLSPILFPVDSEEYIAIAENIAAGKGFTIDGSEPTFHRAPFIPYFLSLLFLIFGSPWLYIASVVNIFASSAVAIIVYFITMRLIHDKTTAIAASLLFTINPVGIFWSGFILTEPFFLFFFTLSILYLLKAADGRHTRDFVICGVLMGLAALSRPVILGAIPFMALWIIFFKNESFAWRDFRGSIKRMGDILKGCAIAALFFILTVLPWSIRNSLTSEEFMFIHSQGHDSLISGLTKNPETHEYIPLFTPEEINKMEHLGHWEYRKEQRERLGRYMLSHPDVILEFMIKKFMMFWSPAPEIGRDVLRADSFIKLLMVLWTMYSVTIYIAGIIGFFSVKDKTNMMLIVFIILGFTLMHTVLIVEPEKRYRLPIEPCLVMLAAAGLSSLYKEKRGMTR